MLQKRFLYKVLKEEKNITFYDFVHILVLTKWGKYQLCQSLNRINISEKRFVNQLIDFNCIA